MFYNIERTVILIDGVALQAIVRVLGISIDYKKFLHYFQEQTHLLRIIYYKALGEEDNIRPLLDWLSYNGYTVVTKPIREFVNGNGTRKPKGNTDVELVVEAMELAERVDHVMIVSNNSDFAALFAAIKRKGVRTTLVSTLETNGENYSIIANELRRQADNWLDLATISEKFLRTDLVKPIQIIHPSPK